MASVLLLGYNRPENIGQRINELSVCKPDRLYVSIDKCNDKSVTRDVLITVEAALSKSGVTFQTELWQQEVNLGLSLHIQSAIDKALEREEEIIVLEDDIRIGHDFVSKLESAYERLSKDREFATVGGFSGIPIFGDHLKNYWRRTKYFSAWGWMIGRGTWDKYERVLSDVDLDAELKNSKSWRSLNTTQQETWLTRFRKVGENPNLTWDYQMQFMTFKYDLAHYLPLYRICENVGFNDTRSTNTKNLQPKWMQSSVIYEGDFSQRLFPEFFSQIGSNVDALTISGDSKLRKSINSVRRVIK